MSGVSGARAVLPPVLPPDLVTAGNRAPLPASAGAVTMPDVTPH